MKPFLFFLSLIFSIHHLKGQSDTTQIAESVLKQEWEVKVLNYRLSGKTASGIHTKRIKEPFVAVSRDLLSVMPLGSYIELFECPWAGKYKVMDKMGKRHSNTIDVFSKKKNKGIKYCKCRPL